MKASRYLLVASLLLLVLFGQLLFSARFKSAIYDEVYHIFTGTAWLLSDQHFVLMGNPPLVNVLQAIPLVLLEDVRWPMDSFPRSEMNVITIVDKLAYPFLWQVNGDRALRLVFLARLPVLGLTLLLAIGVCRWARELCGPGAGLLALLLTVFEPNILAHGRLATTDLGAACAMLWATYLFWRYRLSPDRGRLVLAGLTLGFALATKFSAVLLLPAFSLLSLWPVKPLPRKEWVKATWNSAFALLGILVLAALVLLCAFRLNVADLWAEYDFQRKHFEQGHSAFLMGEYSKTGWWYYFVIAFVLKTPIPLMVLAAVGTVSLCYQWRHVTFLLLPILVIFAVSLFSRVNIGYRYLLPVLPFLIILASGVLSLPRRNTQRATRTVQYAIWTLLLVWYVLGTLLIYPHYLAYFNEAIGGPDNGWRYLVDSNLDWGQDLPGLRAYIEGRGLEKVYLGRFGTAPPELYGIDYDPLPSLLSFPAEAKYRTYRPSSPPPGTYAISATNLPGVYLADRDTYAWFREREPVAKIGYSIFVYDVPHVGGEPVSVCLSGMSIDWVDARTFDAAFGTNDVSLRWFDARAALVLPAGGRDMWLLTAETMSLDPALRERFLPVSQPWGRRQSTRDALPYELYHLTGDTVIELSQPTSSDGMPVWSSPAMTFSPGYERHPLELPVDLDRLHFLGYELRADRLCPGEELLLFAFWQVEAPFEPPLAFFLHLLDAEGQVRGQQDVPSVNPVGLKEGDVFVQVHRFQVSPDVSPGEYPLEIGVYRPDTMQRWPVYEGDEVVTDRLLLRPVIVKAE
jgi:4-amino-4-deoxy-L-arabinose transferase-like glycosyltransferase